MAEFQRKIFTSSVFFRSFGLLCWFVLLFASPALAHSSAAELYANYRSIYGSYSWWLERWLDWHEQRRRYFAEIESPQGDFTAFAETSAFADLSDLEQRFYYENSLRQFTVLKADDLVIVAQAEPNALVRAQLLEAALGNYLLVQDRWRIEATDRALLTTYAEAGDVFWQHYYEARRMMLGLDATATWQQMLVAFDRLATETLGLSEYERIYQGSQHFLAYIEEEEPRSIARNLAKNGLALTLLESSDVNSTWKNSAYETSKLIKQLGLLSVLLEWVHNQEASTLEEALPLLTKHAPKSGVLPKQEGEPGVHYVDVTQKVYLGLGQENDRWILRGGEIYLLPSIQDKQITIEVTEIGGMVGMVRDTPTVQVDDTQRGTGRLWALDEAKLYAKVKLRSSMHFAGDQVGTITVQHGRIIASEYEENKDLHGKLYLALQPSKLRRQWISSLYRDLPKQWQQQGRTDVALLDDLLALERLSKHNWRSRHDRYLAMAKRYRREHSHNTATHIAEDNLLLTLHSREAEEMAAQINGFFGDRHRDQLAAFTIYDLPILVPALALMVPSGGASLGGVAAATGRSVMWRTLFAQGAKRWLIRGLIGSSILTPLHAGWKHLTGRPALDHIWLDFAVNATFIASFGGIRVLHQLGDRLMLKALPFLRKPGGYLVPRMTFRGTMEAAPALSHTGTALSQTALVLEMGMALTAASGGWSNLLSLGAQGPKSLSDWRDLYFRTTLMVGMLHTSLVAMRPGLLRQPIIGQQIAGQRFGLQQIGQQLQPSTRPGSSQPANYARQAEAVALEIMESWRQGGSGPRQPSSSWGEAGNYNNFVESLPGSSTTGPRAATPVNSRQVATRTTTPTSSRTQSPQNNRQTTPENTPTTTMPDMPAVVPITVLPAMPEMFPAEPDATTTMPDEAQSKAVLHKANFQASNAPPSLPPGNDLLDWFAYVKLCAESSEFCGRFSFKDFQTQRNELLTAWGHLLGDETFDPKREFQTLLRQLIVALETATGLERFKSFRANEFESVGREIEALGGKMAYYTLNMVGGRRVMLRLIPESLMDADRQGINVGIVETQFLAQYDLAPEILGVVPADELKELLKLPGISDNPHDPFVLGVVFEDFSDAYWPGHEEMPTGEERSWDPMAVRHRMLALEYFLDQLHINYSSQIELLIMPDGRVWVFPSDLPHFAGVDADVRNNFVSHLWNRVEWADIDPDRFGDSVVSLRPFLEAMGLQPPSGRSLSAEDIDAELRGEGGINDPDETERRLIEGWQRMIEHDDSNGGPRGPQALLDDGTSGESFGPPLPLDYGPPLDPELTEMPLLPHIVLPKTSPYIGDSPGSATSFVASEQDNPLREDREEQFRHADQKLRLIFGNAANWAFHNSPPSLEHYFQTEHGSPEQTTQERQLLVLRAMLDGVFFAGLNRLLELQKLFLFSDETLQQFRRFKERVLANPPSKGRDIAAILGEIEKEASDLIGSRIDDVMISVFRDPELAPQSVRDALAQAGVDYQDTVRWSPEVLAPDKFQQLLFEVMKVLGWDGTIEVGITFGLPDPRHPDRLYQLHATIPEWAGYMALVHEIGHWYQSFSLLRAGRPRPTTPTVTIEGADLFETLRELEVYLEMLRPTDPEHRTTEELLDRVHHLSQLFDYYLPLLRTLAARSDLVTEVETALRVGEGEHSENPDYERFVAFWLSLVDPEFIQEVVETLDRLEERAEIVLEFYSSLDLSVRLQSRPSLILEEETMSESGGETVASSPPSRGSSRSTSVAPARPTSIAQNEPCPCGSGKKFKKCHGAPGGPNALLDDGISGESFGPPLPLDYGPPVDLELTEMPLLPHWHAGQGAAGFPLGDSDADPPFLTPRWIEQTTPPWVVGDEADVDAADGDNTDETAAQPLLTPLAPSLLPNDGLSNLQLQASSEERDAEDQSTPDEPEEATTPAAEEAQPSDAGHEDVVVDLLGEEAATIWHAHWPLEADATDLAEQLYRALVAEADILGRMFDAKLKAVGSNREEAIRWADRDAEGGEAEEDIPEDVYQRYKRAEALARADADFQRQMQTIELLKTLLKGAVDRLASWGIHTLIHRLGLRPELSLGEAMGGMPTWDANEVFAEAVGSLLLSRGIDFFGPESPITDVMLVQERLRWDLALIAFTAGVDPAVLTTDSHYELVQDDLNALLQTLAVVCRRIEVLEVQRALGLRTISKAIAALEALQGETGQREFEVEGLTANERDFFNLVILNALPDEFDVASAISVLADLRAEQNRAVDTKQALDRSLKPLLDLLERFDQFLGEQSDVEHSLADAFRGQDVSEHRLRERVQIFFGGNRELSEAVYKAFLGEQHLEGEAKVEFWRRVAEIAATASNLLWSIVHRHRALPTVETMGDGMALRFQPASPELDPAARAEQIERALARVAVEFRSRLEAREREQGGE